MVELNSLENYCNELLITSSMEDYCPNGVQVDVGSREVRRLVTAVTACQAAIDEAVEMDVDLLLVHLAGSILLGNLFLIGTLLDTMSKILIIGLIVMIRMEILLLL